MKHEQKVLAHSVHALLGTVEARVQKSIETKLVPSGWEGWLPRVVTVAALAQKRIEGGDPDLISLATLDAIQSSLQKALNELAAFESDRTEAHLEAADRHLDSVLHAISQLFVVARAEDAAALRTGMSSLKREASKNLGELRTSTDEISRQAADVRKKLEEANKTIAEQKARLDSIVADSLAMFGKSESERAARFASVVDEQAKSFAEAKNLNAEEAKQLLSQAASRLESTQKQHEQELKKSQEIVGLIASTGMAGGFERSANAHRKAKRFWRGAAATFLLGFVAFALVLFFSDMAEHGTWKTIVTKALVVLAFGALGTWAARIGADHARDERRLRQRQLELASVGPYSELLPEEQRTALRVELAQVFFGSEDHTHGEEQSATNDQPLNIIKLALETVQSALKKQ